MAQQSEAGIPRAGKRKWGYDPAQVDAFLERAHALYDSDGAKLTQRDIQNVSFDLTRGGYEIAQVDAALARLERAVVDKQTTWEITQHGRVTWKAQTEELYREVAKHLDRAERERFGSGKPRTPSYDRKQVDRLSDQIADKAAAELGLDGVSRKDVRDLDKITADYVSNAVFTQRKGKKGYDERQVDYFLNTCVQLLSRIESFDRVADYVTSDGAGEQDAQSALAPAPVASDASASADGVAPLFSPDAQYQRPSVPQTDGTDAPQSYAPVASATPAAPLATARTESFDALSQAEQSLFAPAAEAPIASPSVVVAGNAAAASQQAAAAAPSPVVAPAVTPIVTPTPSVSPAEPAPTAAFSAAPATAAYPSTPSYAPVTTTVSTPSAVSTQSYAPVAPVAPHTDAVPSASSTPAAGSLAALAHMAEVSQELPAIDVPSFTPKLPSLDIPSVTTSDALPSFTSTPTTAATTSTPTASTTPTTSTTSTSATANPFSLLSSDNNDLEIPDLSFPTIGSFDTIGGDEKKQQ